MSTIDDTPLPFLTSAFQCAGSAPKRVAFLCADGSRFEVFFCHVLCSYTRLGFWRVFYSVEALVGGFFLSFVPSLVPKMCQSFQERFSLVQKITQSDLARYFCPYTTMFADTFPSHLVSDINCLSSNANLTQVEDRMPRGNVEQGDGDLRKVSVE